MTRIEALKTKENPFAVTSLNQMILTPAIKNKVNLIVQAARKTGHLPGHILLDGLSGGGKTTLTDVLAAELGFEKYDPSDPDYDPNKPYIVHCGISTNFMELIINLYKSNVPGANIRRIFFIDEAHAIPKQIYEFLLTVIENQTASVSRNGTNYTLELPYSTWIVATTNPELMPRPFVNRFRHRITFYPYEVQELEKIARLNAPRVGLDLDNESFKMLARISRSTPRILNSILKNLVDFTAITEDTDISFNDFIQFMDYVGTDKYGMTEAERIVIKVLGEGPNLTTMSLKNLAVATGIDTTTLTEDVEPFLIREGYLKTTTAGRMLTLKGNEHYKLIRGSNLSP